MGRGHFGVGLAAKRFAPRAHLGVLLLASDALDLLWAVFHFAGIERIDRKGRQTSAPWSHGLFMSGVWSAIAGLLGARLYRDNRTGVVIGLLVFSHWLLDFVSHPMARVSLKPFTVTPTAPDLPVFFDRSPKVGLGMYNSVGGVIAGVVAELGLLALGIVSYVRTRSAAAKADGGGTAINLGGVNSYLVEAGDGFVLIDTGFSTSRAQIERELERAGCTPGRLKLVVLTHGDHDHAGNGAYLREKYRAPIAMHGADSGMVERGDMTWNRKARPDKYSLSFKIVGSIVSFFARSTRFDSFTPDLTIDEGFDLSEYGFDARVLHIPGHSKGSIGVLTAGGDLFCGDLLYNVVRPGFPVSIDDLADYDASIEKLRGLRIGTVYPGHGKPFRMERFLKN
ncbi:MAG: MBL fold metallo-hydrolase [Chloroflexi bacterium]|nr:MBL fold metallo-hydrolase [Chloroflexota bacterium]